MGINYIVQALGDNSESESTAKVATQIMAAAHDRSATNRLSIDDALIQARMDGWRPVILAISMNKDGNAGQLNFVLKRMLELTVTNAAIGPFGDSAAVEKAFAAGEGAQLQLRFREADSAINADFFDAFAVVKKLHHNLTQTDQQGERISVGRSALLNFADIDILLTTTDQPAIDVDLFYNMDCDLASKQLIAVNLARNFNKSFSFLSKRITRLDQ